MLASVVLEAAIVAVVASVGGMGVGIGIADALFTTTGSTLPVVALVLTPGTLIPGFVLGVIVTLVASVVPALRATSISPTTALREGAGAERRPGGVSLIASFVPLTIAAASPGYGVLGNPSGTNTRLLLIAIGSLTLILGTPASATRLVGPIVHITGSPMRRFVPGVALVTSISREVTPIKGGQAHAAFGVDPKTFLSGYTFDWKHGSYALVPALGASGSSARSMTSAPSVATSSRRRPGTRSARPATRR